MTTEIGLYGSKEVGKKIEALYQRLAFLEQKVTPDGYALAEAAALRWALPVLEAERMAIHPPPPGGHRRGHSPLQ